MCVVLVECWNERYQEAEKMRVARNNLPIHLFRSFPSSLLAGDESKAAEKPE